MVKTTKIGKHLNPGQAILLLRGICKGDYSASIAREIGVSRQMVLSIRRAIQGQAERIQPQTPTGVPIRGSNRKPLASVSLANHKPNVASPLWKVEVERRKAEVKDLSFRFPTSHFRLPLGGQEGGFGERSEHYLFCLQTQFFEAPMRIFLIDKSQPWLYNIIVTYHRDVLPFMVMREGKLLVVNQFYPSSKRCSRCGTIKEELPLDQRVYLCEKQECLLVIDRDLNAAINLLNLAGSSSER